MPRVILLAGMPTAGATRLQEALIRNEAPLAELGIRLMRSGRDGPRATENALVVDDLTHATWVDLREEIANARATDDTYIFANSGIWALEVEHLTSLADAFVGFDIACVTYLVEQADHLQRSLLQTQRRPDRAVEFDDPAVFEDWMSSKVDALDYLEAAKRLTAVFSASRAHFRGYTATGLAAGDVVVDFFHLLEAHEAPGVDLQPRPELTLSAEMARVLRQHGASLAEAARPSDVLDLALRLSTTEADSASFLSSTQLEAIRGRFAASNRRLFGSHITNIGAFELTGPGQDPSDENTQRLHQQLREALDNWVRLGDRGWNGKMGMARRIFASGWDLQRRDGQVVATQEAGTSSVRFRLPFRRSGTLRPDEPIDVRFGTSHPERATIQSVVVNGEPLGDFDLSKASVTVPRRALGPIDDIELVCTPVHGDQPPLEVVDLTIG